MGTFVLALHSHLPYCRGAGRWPHGEEWIHEAVLGTYLPLLVLLHDLRDAGVPFRIVIGLTPVLLEQLADHDVDVRNLEYIDDQVRRAERDVRRFVDADDHASAALAGFYVDSFRRLREAYRTRFGRDLVGAFADLARTGHVEILTSAATHGYLPLLDRASGQVWSAFMGYPGDAHYREFHRKDDQSGLRYWRVTSVHKGLSEKEQYSPGRAAERAREHASHFVSVVREELAGPQTDGQDPLLAVTFDSELFGHWWFEGVDWLGLVLRELATSDVAVATAVEYLDREPPRERVALAEGSWGKNNDHSTWLNESTAWMWDELERLAGEMRALDGTVSRDDPLRERAGRQAMRELLLAQSSDWPFLVTTGQAADYAVERFRAHAQRFRRAVAIARGGDPYEDETELRSIEHADNPFPDAALADFQN